MEKVEEEKTTLNIFLCWTPRILLLIYGLSMLFFPMDGFSNTGFGVLLNRIPVFVVLIISAVSWKHDHWAPRIFSILFILFMMMFSLDEISDDLWRTVRSLFMHNIPAFILLIVLVISWKRELVGAVVFNLAGLLYIFVLTKRFISWHQVVSWFMGIGAPAFVIGIIYWVVWMRKKQGR